MNQHYYYLLLDFLVISIPLMWSFGPKVSYYKSFVPLFLGIAIVGGFFIIWDVIFTVNGIWGFNPRYLSGIELAALPLGEWLFFVCIPFSCVFIYRSLNYYLKKGPSRKLTGTISNFLIAFCISLAVIYHDRWYTVITFSLLGILIYWHHNLNKTRWLGRFYLAYLIVLIPFFITNGILTGTGIEEEIVWYNDDENMGRRIATIPFEDAFYGMLLILGVITFYEHFGSKWKMLFAYQETVTE